MRRGGALGALRHRQAAMLVDRFDAEGPVAAEARQHGADRVIPKVLRERDEQHVDRMPFPRRAGIRCQDEAPAGDAGQHPGRHDIDVVSLQHGARRGGLDLQAAIPGKDLRKCAFAIRIEMQQDDVGDASAGLCGAEKGLQGLYTAGGGANSCHGGWIVHCDQTHLSNGDFVERSIDPNLRMP
jgi:hypothetical protein